jgi:hypothetical protein
MMRKIMILILVLTGLAYSREMPIGVYDGDSTRLIRDISLMKDSLGVNFIYGSINDSIVSTLSQAGYDIIKWGSRDQNNPNIMSAYSYFKVQAEDASSAIKFETRVGSDSGGVLFSANSGNMLDNLIFCQYPKMHFNRDDCEDPKMFKAKVRMALDTAGVPEGTLIGKIVVCRYKNNAWDTVAVIPINADDSLLTGNMFEVPMNPPSFRLCIGDSADACDWAYNVKYSFWNNGVTTVYLDYLKAYEERGLEIVETNLWDDSIRASVTGGWRDAVDYWWLRDEPRYDHFAPYKHVKPNNDILIPISKNMDKAIK